MLIRACAFTHMYTHTGGLPRACTRLVLHRRPSYESLDALSRRWISRGTLLQQVHRGAALQSAAGADSAARRPCPRSTVCVCVCVRVLRNAESRRGICFALWQTRRHRDPRHFIRRDRGSCEFDFVREEEGFRDFFFESLQITYDEKVLLYFGSIKDVFD